MMGPPVWVACVRLMVPWCYGCVAVCSLVCVAVFLNFQVYASAPMPAFFHVYAPFSFYRALYLISNACRNNACLTVAGMAPGTEMFSCLIAMAFQIVVRLGDGVSQGQGTGGITTSAVTVHRCDTLR